MLKKLDVIKSKLADASLVSRIEAFDKIIQSHVDAFRNSDFRGFVVLFNSTLLQQYKKNIREAERAAMPAPEPMTGRRFFRLLEQANRSQNNVETPLPRQDQTYRGP